MKKRLLLPIIFGILATTVFGQQTVVINDPTISPQEAKLSPADEKLIKTQVFPKLRKKWVSADSACTEEFTPAGVVKGAFSQPNSNQTLVFYSFCQTGNGLGNNGLTLIENGKIIRNYVAESGWNVDLKVLPDINQNGLNEFALYYSGGMHQGQGGTGVDVMEFTASGLKGIGWFNAETFTETSDFSYKVSVKTGKTPVFYREKYINKNDKWRKSGQTASFKLSKIYSNFEVLK
jgi:hypothetical protein